MFERAAMNVLLLTRYGRLGASSRQRFLQYLPYLESRGFKITISPLQRDDFVTSLQYGRMNFPTVIRCYLGRLKALLRTGVYDLLWIEKELLPWVPAWLESILSPRAIPFVVDYDDAFFHRYGLHRNTLVRAMFGRKLDRVMRRAAMVVVGNDYLGNHARHAGAKRVVSLPTVVDTDRYRVGSIKKNGMFTVGWIGSPYTQTYLQHIGPALREICCLPTARLTLVGAEHVSLPGVEVQIRRWSEDTEVSDIQDFDVGIMCLPDEPFERGKCGYKLIQYMACGKPVVASPVGINSQIVENGVTGFLANNAGEWIQALTVLRDDPTLRARMGQAGRDKVESRYCLQVTAPQLESLLREAAQKGG